MALLLGNNTVSDFPLTDNLYSSSNGEWFLSFPAIASGTVENINLSINTKNATTAIKLALRDSAGNLLAIGDGTPIDGNTMTVSIADVSVVEGETYLLGFLPDTGSPSIYHNDVQYSIRSDSASSYSTPADPLDPTSSTLAVREVMIWAEGSTGPSLSITDNLIPGESIAITTTDFVSPPTGARITGSNSNVKEIILDSPTQVTLPPLGDTSYVLFGDVTLEVYNDTESATITIPFDPPAEYPYLVELVANPSNLTNTGFLYNWSPENGYEGAQVIAPFEIDANGNIVLVPEDGDYTLYAIDPLDGMMEKFIVTIKDGVVIFTKADKIEPSYKITNLTENNLNIDGVTLEAGGEIDVVFKSKNIRYAEELGLITVGFIKTGSDLVANLEKYIQEKYESNLKTIVTIESSQN